MRVHSLTLSYTLESMKCDSQASFLARTLASPYLGHEPKAKVATFSMEEVVDLMTNLQVDIMADPLMDLQVDILADPLIDLQMNIL